MIGTWLRGNASRITSFGQGGGRSEVFERVRVLRLATRKCAVGVSFVRSFRVKQPGQPDRQPSVHPPLAFKHATLACY
jgi:hypothetical protein